MADINYTITIKTEGNASSKPKKVASTSSGERVDSESDSFSAFVKKANAIRKCAAVGYATKYLDVVITAEINRVELRTGSSTLQQKISYEYGMAKRIALSSAAIIGGAVMGNPLAVVGGLASLVDIGVQAAIAQKDLDIARAVEGVGLEMANIRAGANGGRSGRS